MAERKRYTKADVNYIEPFSDDGRIAGHVVEMRDGRAVTLLTPSGKGKKYAKELKEGVRYTNDGEFKKTRDGKARKVTNEGRAYRAGYLDAQKDSAKAYKAKKGR